MKFDQLCKVLLEDRDFDDDAEFKDVDATETDEEFDEDEISQEDAELMGLLFMSHVDELEEAKEHEKFYEIVQAVRAGRQDAAAAREILLGVRDAFGDSVLGDEDDDDDDSDMETARGYGRGSSEDRYESRGMRRYSLDDRDLGSISRGLRQYRDDERFSRGDDEI